jgi:hypothetical protein
LTAQAVTERLRGGPAPLLAAGLDTLAGWLERGDCTRRNAASFYTMVQVPANFNVRFMNRGETTTTPQAASGHVKRLLGERAEAEQEQASQRAGHTAHRRALQAQCECWQQYCTARHITGSLARRAVKKASRTVLGFLQQGVRSSLPITLCLYLFSAKNSRHIVVTDYINKGNIISRTIMTSQHDGVCRGK